MRRVTIKIFCGVILNKFYFRSFVSHDAQNGTSDCFAVKRPFLEVDLQKLLKLPERGGERQTERESAHVSERAAEIKREKRFTFFVLEKRCGEGGLACLGLFFFFFFKKTGLRKLPGAGGRGHKPH